MREIKKLVKDKNGNTTPLTIALILALLFTLCALSEFFRLSVIANGVRNALQSAVISVATTNYDEVYNGLREGYSGGYWLSGDQWEENLDYGDIYEQLDELLHAVDLTLTPEQIEKLEAPYKPHPIVGFK